MEVEPQAKRVPMIREYTCYRAFMRDSYQYKKASHAGFSFRRFSQMAGLKSPNYLQMVMIKKRSLSLDLAVKVARVLCKTPAEQSYFVALVKLASAFGSRETEDANQEVMVAVKRMSAKEIPREQEAIFSHWYFMVIRELVFLPTFQPTGSWISEKLRGLISPDEAEMGLKTLIKCDFIKQSKAGKYTASEPVICTPLAIDNHRILVGHMELLQAWIKILPRIKAEDRELGFLNIPIAKDKLPEFKNRIRRFQDEIIGWLHDEKNPEMIVQLGTYLVPISIEESE